MTKGEWVNSIDPGPMMAYLRGHPVEKLTPFFGRFARSVEYPDRRVAERVHHLFAVACCRRIARVLTPERVQQAVRRFESLGGRLHEPIPIDGCLKAIDTAERFTSGLASEDELVQAMQVASATQSLLEFYDSVYDSEMGPYDSDLAATGEAAQAVMDACSGDDFLDQAAGHCARALGWLAASGGEPDATAASAESAEQCRLLRELVGDPFTAGE
jgi:hypothetical protein